MDQAALTTRLQAVLSQVVGESGHSRAAVLQNLDPTADFAVLGVNSVDLMEFILRVESELGIDVLGNLLPEEVPSTLVGWAQFLLPRLDGSTSVS